MERLWEEVGRLWEEMGKLWEGLGRRGKNWNGCGKQRQEGEKWEVCGKNGKPVRRSWNSVGRSETNLEELVWLWE